MRENIIVMVGGRSGVGKTSIIDFLVKNQGERYARPLSYTSRLKRNGEGCEEYNFISEEKMILIISVIKMSECYDVSLDYLLKGEQKMKTYYDYLEESTNVVKSNANRNRIITILAYLLIWAFAMIVFWFFTSGSDAMGYSLMFLWIILPVTTFIVSVVIGKNNFWGKGKWAFTIFFGAMYMLAEYGTFKMANNIAFNKLNAPDFGMIVAGAIISAIGMLVGSLCNKKRPNQNREE